MTTVYLDHNQWIFLARAATGHPQGRRYQGVLRDLREAVGSKRARFALSATTYQEMDRTASLRRRRDVASVMEELTGFLTIAPAGSILAEEIDLALHRRFGRPFVPRRCEKFGQGVGFALTGQALRGRIVADSRVAGPGTPRPGDSVRRRWEDELTRLAERFLLTGPSDEEKAAIPGYRPEKVWAVAEVRRAREDELARMLREDPRWRSRLQDIVCARELFHEVNNRLAEATYLAGISKRALDAWDKQGFTEFLYDLPSRATSITLKIENLKQRDRRWKVNDIADIDAMSLAVPYCQVVIPDAHVWSLLTRSELPARFGTTIVRRLEDLPDAIG